VCQKDVAISGSTILVGATQRNLHDEWGNLAQVRHGKAYVFVKQGTEWIEEEILYPDDGISDGFLFGNSVDLDGDTAIIGHEDSAGGNVHIFFRNAGSWSLQGKPWPLIPSDYDECFGCSVKVKGDLALMGTFYSESYLFSRIGSAWTQKQEVYLPRFTWG